EARSICLVLSKRCPQWTMEGERNLWVLKPPENSRGIGIKVISTLDEALEAQRGMGGRVIQKYVEALLPVDMPGHTACNPHLDPDGVTEEEQPPKSCLITEASSGSRKCPPTDMSGGQECLRVQHGAGQRHATMNNGRGSAPSVSTSVQGKMATTPVKFDIRVWVLVTSWDPLQVYMFEPCYLRLCSRPFTLSTNNFKDQYVHLTNFNVQRRNQCLHHPCPCYSDVSKPPTEVLRALRGGLQVGRISRCVQREGDKNQEGERRDFGENSFQSQQEVAGGQGGRNATAEKLSTNTRVEGGDSISMTRGQRLWRERVWPGIKCVVRSTLRAGQPHMVPRSGCFELLGFDILLDCELKPWLLEVNLSPALSHRSEQQGSLIRAMCDGLLNLVIDQAFPSPGKEEDKDNLVRVTPPAQSNTHYQVDAVKDRGRWISITSLPYGADSILPTGASDSMAHVSPEQAQSSEDLPQSLIIRGKRLIDRKQVAQAEWAVQLSGAVTMIARWWRLRGRSLRVQFMSETAAATLVTWWRCKRATLRRQQQQQQVWLGKRDRAASTLQGTWHRYQIVKQQREVYWREFGKVMTGRKMQRVWKRCLVNNQLDSICLYRRLYRRLVAQRGLRVWAKSFLLQRRHHMAVIIQRTIRARIHKRQQEVLVLSAAFHHLLHLHRLNRAVLCIQRFGRVVCLFPARLVALATEGMKVSTTVKAAQIVVRTLRR
ncbi:unnamed protein product, partial [Choristocarpus tenellus]